MATKSKNATAICHHPPRIARAKVVSRQAFRFISSTRKWRRRRETLRELNLFPLPVAWAGATCNNGKSQTLF